VSPEPLVLATRSRDKVRELRELFSSIGRPLLTLEDLGIAATSDEELLESADTFEGNALAKGRHFARRTGRPVIADDSGLEVKVLGGRPGVFSKRWSGRSVLSGKALDDANNALLIAELAGVRDRRARYVCAAALCDANGDVVFRGTTGGVILEEPRGGNGFGYDPYFFSAELGKTFGEASLEEKQRVSHRARAFRALLDALDGRG
jgi:XTP/dITP diphosphohydrolase